MISLFNYLQECGDCATPSNTMGIGNPIPADIGAVGTEPLVGSKKKKKKNIKESIFDDEEETLYNAATLSAIKDWVETNIDSIRGKYTIEQINDKYKVSFSPKFLSGVIEEEIPEYIVLDLTNVKAIEIELNSDYKGKEKGKFTISNDNFILSPNTKLYIFIDSLRTSEIEFDGEFDCETINISDASSSPIRGIKHIILHKNYKCNWTVCGGLKNLKKISCVGGIPTVIDRKTAERDRILLPEFGQQVEIVKI